jgi:hypothetical protein
MVYYRQESDAAIRGRSLPMSRRSLLAAAGLVVTLLVLTASLALAWPDEPPDSVLISGPGLAGTIKITDPRQLAAFKLGTLEDFDQGVLAAPPQTSGTGYQITRYFGGDFNFASLRYFPDPAGGAGYLYFEDGPDLNGSHTPFNGHWLRARPQGEAALQQVLVALKPQVESPKSTPTPSLARLPLTLLAVMAVVLAGAWSALRQPLRRAGQPSSD